MSRKQLRSSVTLALLLVAPALSACSLTLPVTGELQSSHETFTGSATRHVDGAGEMEITLASGTKCVGRFVYVTPREGSGTLKCTDGRSGTFDFVSTGQRGTGSGQLEGRPFTLIFG